MCQQLKQFSRPLSTYDFKFVTNCIIGAFFFHSENHDAYPCKTGKSGIYRQIRRPTLWLGLSIVGRYECIVGSLRQSSDYRHTIPGHSWHQTRTAVFFISVIFAGKWTTLHKKARTPLINLFLISNGRCRLLMIAALTQLGALNPRLGYTDIANQNLPTPNLPTELATKYQFYILYSIFYWNFKNKIFTNPVLLEKIVTYSL